MTTTLILDAAVVGFPDEIFGERVVAFIVISEDDPDFAEIQQVCPPTPSIIQGAKALRMRRGPAAQSGWQGVEDAAPQTSAFFPLPVTCVR